MATPKIALIGIDGQAIAASTLPETGQKDSSGSLPVIVASGVEPVQTYVAIPKFDQSTTGNLNASMPILVQRNPARRYLKIINNGPVDIEIWTGAPPDPNNVGRTIPRGEVLFSQGGLVEVGERISIIYATSFQGDSGVMILEG